MPFIDAVAKIDLPYKASQQQVKEQVRQMFLEDIPQIDRLMPAFENTEIQERNFVQPLDYYKQDTTFEQRNDQYKKWALHYAIQAIEQVLQRSATDKMAVTDLLFVSTTGLATPSIDAQIINAMRLDPHINRTPVWGLGCAGGTAGVAKGCVLAAANPKAIILVVAIELCSLTLIKNDYSKSNFIGSSLFSDGIAACIIKGDDYKPGNKKCSYVGHSSKLYYETEDIMGWEFGNEGFKVVFSKDIPTFINEHIRGDIEAFLSRHQLQLSDIRNFIFHPGGTKVLQAYASALEIGGEQLANTKDVMSNYGNMSSATVLYVLEKFMAQGFDDGYGLMLAMGPGFSSEMLLLNMKNA
jgi:alkylresorcinol/alkylpyrone synthase